MPNGAGRILIVRHAESEGNASRRFTLSAEEPLTELGRRQAQRSAEVLRGRFAPVRLLSSPYRRARETAEVIGASLGLPVEIEPAVREQHFGELHGQPYDAVARMPGFDSLPRWEWRPPGGETLAEVRSRAAPVLERIAREHSESEVVLVTHGGTILALWSHLVGSWERARSLGNAEICVVGHDGRRFEEPLLVDSEGL
jgi:broad specificity phosphatase PhoE